MGKGGHPEACPEVTSGEETAALLKQILAVLKAMDEKLDRIQMTRGGGGIRTPGDRGGKALKRKLLVR